MTTTAAVSSPGSGTTRRLGPPPSMIVDASGTLQSGAYRGHLPRVDLSPLGKGRLYRVTHHKRWMYFTIATDELLVCAAVANIGYVANSFVFALELDSKRGSLAVDTSSLGPTAIVKVGDSALDPCVARYAFGRHEVKIDRVASAYEVAIDVKDLSLRATVDSKGAPPAIGIVAPVPGGVVDATEKGALLGVEGNARLHGRHYDLHGGWGGYDYTNGYLARHTAWKWAYGLGRAKDGRRVALNLVEGFIGETECVVWIEDELYPVGEGRFTFDPASPLGPWHVATVDGAVALDFAPLGLHAEHKNFGVIASKFIQPSGFFRGTIKIPGLPDVEVERFAGVTEDQDILW